MQASTNVNRSRGRHARNAAGVTLIELLVVMAIVGLLTAIATPSYMRYMMRTHRAAAKSCMTEYAQFMERYYTEKMTYVDAAPDPACKTDGGLDAQYTLSVGSVTTRAYIVTATPINSQLTRDTQCGVLTLDQAGTRTEAGTGDLTACWSR